MLFFQRRELPRDRSLRYGVLYFAFGLHLAFVIMSFFVNTIKKDSDLIVLNLQKGPSAIVAFGEFNNSSAKIKHTVKNEEKIESKPVVKSEAKPIVKPIVRPIKKVENKVEKKIESKVVASAVPVVKKTDVVEPRPKLEELPKVSKDIVPEKQIKVPEAEKVQEEVVEQEESVDSQEDVLQKGDMAIRKEILSNLTVVPGFKGQNPIKFTFEIGFNGKARSINARHPETPLVVYSAIKKAILKSCFSCRGRTVTVVLN